MWKPSNWNHTNTHSCTNTKSISSSWKERRIFTKSERERKNQRLQERQRNLRLTQCTDANQHKKNSMSLSLSLRIRKSMVLFPSNRKPSLLFFFSSTHPTIGISHKDTTILEKIRSPHFPTFVTYPISDSLSTRLKTKPFSLAQTDSRSLALCLSLVSLFFFCQWTAGFQRNPALLHRPKKKTGSKVEQRSNLKCNFFTKLSAIDSNRSNVISTFPRKRKKRGGEHKLPFKNEEPC